MDKRRKREREIQFEMKKKYKKKASHREIEKHTMRVKDKNRTNDKETVEEWGINDTQKDMKEKQIDREREIKGERKTDIE